MIEGVRLSDARGQLSVGGARQQPTDPASAFAGSAKIGATGVADQRDGISGAFLDDQSPVIDVPHFARRSPGAVGPREFLPDSATEQPVVNVGGQRGAAAGIGDDDRVELIFIVVSKRATSVRKEIPVAVVRVAG